MVKDYNPVFCVQYLCNRTPVLTYVLVQMQMNVLENVWGFMNNIGLVSSL